MENKSVNKQTTRTTYNGKSKTHATYFSKIQPLKKNMFTDACSSSGILKEKPELDYALFKAYEQIKQELCNNNIYDHLNKQAKRGYDFVRYVLNFDPNTKKYSSNVVEITTPSGYRYKIVKTQFFVDKNIRNIFYEKIADWYKLKYDLAVEFKSKQITSKTWNCAVYVQNPILSNNSKEITELSDEEVSDNKTRPDTKKVVTDLSDEALDNKTCQDTEKVVTDLSDEALDNKTCQDTEKVVTDLSDEALDNKTCQEIKEAI
jgi:hypothetical protein